MQNKRYINDINTAISNQLGTVEQGLAQDIEALKNNVERSNYDTNERQAMLEEKLKDFTIELDIENGRLKMDMEAMKKVVDRMHQKNVQLDLLSSSVAIG